MIEARAVVVAEALSWIGTPFVYGQCVKGVGVDCGRYLAAVFNNAGIKKIDIGKLPNIPPFWFLHKHVDTPSPYLSAILKYSVEYIVDPKVPEPGTIVVAKEARDWAHGAIVVAWPKVIGAAYEHCVTLWQDIHTSPQYSHRELKFLDAFDQTAGGNP